MEKNTSATSPEATSNSERKPGGCPEEKYKPHNKAVGHILSVIAFALAITSYTTTKRGMNDYIFPGVLGVCVSFGVQAMLFCLSLTIPRYWSVVRKIGRIVMAWMLIVLILVSSGFTYIYAVNVVYASTDYINSGNIIVKRYNSEIKDAREYVEESLKACRLEMSTIAAKIKEDKSDSNESDAPTSTPTPTPTSTPTPTPTPDATPTPEGIPSEIDTPAPYTPAPEQGGHIPPNAVFCAYHDYEGTNITVIVVAGLDADGYIIQDGTMDINYFNNQPSTVDDCEREIDLVDRLISYYDVQSRSELEYADRYELESNNVIPYRATITRYRDNARAYRSAVEKLKIIRGNIGRAKEMLGSNIDHMLNELLTAMLNTDPVEIASKLKELKEKLPSQREMLDSNKYSEIVGLLQEASIIAEKYGTLLDIQSRLQQLSTSLTLSEPSSTEPSSTEPSSTEPSSAEPSSAEPSSTEPSSAEPSSAEPSSAEPSSAEPSSAEPSSAEPSSTEPSSAEPSSAEPSSAEPSSDKPWSYSSYLDLTAKAQSAYDEIRKIEDKKEDQRTQEEINTIVKEKEKITDWENISIEMIAGLANEIRHIPRTVLDEAAEVNNEIREYDPITRANKLQNEIRNRVRLEDANKLEMAVRRLVDLDGYPLLAWITLAIAFVCDLTALGAGVVNNKLAIHNATPERVVGMEAISNIKEHSKLEHKLNRIKRRSAVRKLVQDNLWDWWKKLMGKKNKRKTGGDDDKTGGDDDNKK